jgi:PAS domain S-box-containing protein
MSAPDLSEGSLLEYIYQSQLRLIVCDQLGTVELMTPVAAQLLMPLARNGRLDNLFEVLKRFLPKLSDYIAHSRNEIVCDGLQFEVPWQTAPRVMSLNLHRLGKDKFLATITDVTDSARETEKILTLQVENLRSSQAQIKAQALLYSDFYDFSPVGFISFDRNSVILKINLVGAKMLGHERSSLVGMHFDDIVCPSDREYFLSGLHTHFSKAQKFSCELRLTSAKKFEINIRLEGTLSLDGSECNAIMQDITDARAMQDILARSEERFRVAMEASSDGLWDWNISNNSCYCSPGYFTLLGYAPDAFVVPSLEWEKLIYPQDIVGSRAQVIAFLRSAGSSLEIKCRMKSGDGSWKWVLCKGKVVVRDSNGRALRAVGSIIDITEQRKSELALARAQNLELETANRIQQTLLLAPPSRQHAGLWMSSFNQAARGIDGDFFDLFRVGKNIVDVIVGDVMGKGLPAALIGAATKLQFSRSLADILLDRLGHEELPEPMKIVTAVNTAMTQHLQSLEAFVTLVYLRIDFQANRLTWVGCGHEETLVVDRLGNQRLLGNQHPPFGLSVNGKFVQSHYPLHPGDAVFLCSDGAPDALMKNGQRLGRERINLEAAKQIRHHATPTMALHALRRELSLHQLEMTDDLTMVMLMRCDSQRTITRLDLNISLNSLRQLRDFMTEICIRLPEKKSNLLTVAAVEVVTNVIRHGRGLVLGAPIEIMAEQSTSGVLLDFKYLGERFEPPSDSAETDFTAFPEGGFGLQIIRQASDQMEYDYHEGVNTLRLYAIYS